MLLAKERCTADRFLPVWVRHEHLARYEFAATHVSGRTVVDCACGDGTGSLRFARAGAAQVFAIDASVEAIEHAARTCTQERIKFQLGNAIELPFLDRIADVFISLETIEHLQDDVSFLREVVRVLRPEGVFVCSTPNRSICNPGKTIDCKPVNPFHVREYNHDEFARLLSTHFRSVQWFGQNRKTVMVSRMMAWLGKWLPAHGAVRLGQLFKLPRFLYDRISHHRVVPASTPHLFEYFVAVCRTPFIPAPTGHPASNPVE